MDAKIEYHLKQHVEVLSQNMNNTSTDHPTLIKMIVRILIIGLINSTYWNYWIARF